jgi:hypothetical protein
MGKPVVQTDLELTLRPHTQCGSSVTTELLLSNDSTSHRWPWSLGNMDGTTQICT